MRLRRRFALLVVALALVGAATACGGDDDDAASDSTADTESDSSSDADGDGGGDDAAGDGSSDAGESELCSLLTPDDLETVFGTPYTEGASTSVEVQCQWVSEDTSESVNVVKGGDYDVTVTALEESGTELSEVDDVGDGAYLTVGGPTAQLGVDVDGTAYIFSYGSLELDPEKVEDQLVAVAEKALERL